MKKILLISIISFLSMRAYGEVRTFNITDSCRLVIEKGDITKCQAEAIVNAANEQLLGGAGVCGAIFNAAGWEKLQRACNKYSLINGVRCLVGTACITDSFNLKTHGIKKIIHAVGPDCRIIKNEDEQNTLLSQAYINSLKLADKYSIKSIAFPFISSAIYAFPRERAAHIALKTVLDHLKNNLMHVISVHFILFSDDDFNLFYKVMLSLFKK